VSADLPARAFPVALTREMQVIEFLDAVKDSLMFSCPAEQPVFSGTHALHAMAGRMRAVKIVFPFSYLLHG
jgi:hypothetical protein